MSLRCVYPPKLELKSKDLPWVCIKEGEIPRDTCYEVLHCAAVVAQKGWVLLSWES